LEYIPLITLGLIGLGRIYFKYKLAQEEKMRILKSSAKTYDLSIRMVIHIK